MRELLPDNIALMDHLEALPGAAGVAAFGRDPPKQREVPSLLTWVASFVTYVVIVSERHPEKVKGLLAYMRLVVGKPSVMVAMGG